jgi:hypothetical protein
MKSAALLDKMLSSYDLADEVSTLTRRLPRRALSLDLSLQEN